MWKSADNYQVQENLPDGRWVWFSDFETYRQAREMNDVYRKFYPNKTFRIDAQYMEK